MMELVIIYILGVVFVGMVSVWYVKGTDEDVTLLDLVKLVVLTLVSWLAVLLFVVALIAAIIDKHLGKIIIIKKGYKEEEE